MDDAATVRDAVDTVLAATGGVGTRRRLVAAIGRAAFDNEVRAGWLVAPFPRAYCRPWLIDQADVLERAALTSIGPPAALSHLTALTRLELLPPERTGDERVHVTVPISRSLRQQSGLVVHRTREFPPVGWVGGLPTVMPAAAIVTTWPLLPPALQREPAITAVRRGLTRPAELRAELARQRRVPGREGLAALIDLLAGGCESELEIWGLIHVFDAPGLRHGQRQYWITAGGFRYRLDLAFEVERVAVELDGWAAHGTKAARERDVRRDSALAAAGWLTLRFSFRRLHTDPAGCRRETLAVLASRRP